MYEVLVFTSMYQVLTMYDIYSIYLVMTYVLSTYQLFTSVIDHYYTFFFLSFVCS